MSRPRSCLILAVLVALAYLESPRIGFLYDDHKVVVESPVVRSLTQIPVLVSPDYFLLSGDPFRYRPVATLTHILTTSLLGTAPWIHHTANLLLHILATLLLFWLLDTLLERRSASFLGALWFGLHPAISEAVLCVTFRRDTLVLLFGLAALVALFPRRPFIGGPTPFPSDESPDTGTPTSYRIRVGLSGFFYALALGSKETAVVFVLLWPLMILCHGPALGVPTGKKRGLALRLFAVYLAVTIAFLALSIGLILSSSIQPEPTIAATLSQRIVHALHHLGVYLMLLVWPWPLALERPSVGPILPTDPHVWIGLLAVVALGFLGARSTRSARNRPNGASCPANGPDFPDDVGSTSGSLFWTGVALTLVPLLPVLVFAWQRTAERYLYVPAAGVALLLGLGIDRGSGAATRSWRPWVLLLVVLANTLVLIRHIHVWVQPVTLWQQTLEAFPENQRAHVALAAALDLGRPDARKQARWHLEKALQLDPDYDSAVHGLAVVAHKDGRLKDASDLYLRYLARRPVLEDRAAAEYAALLFNELGLVKEAVLLLQGHAAHHGHVAPGLALAKAYRLCGLTERAREVLEDCRRQFPGDPRPSQELAKIPPTADSRLDQDLAYESLMSGGELGSQTPFRRACGLALLGKTEEAEREYRTELSRRPGNRYARSNLAALYSAKGRLQEADRELTAVLRDAPDFVPAIYHLAHVALRLGQKDRSAKLVERGLHLEPGNPDFLRLAGELGAKEPVIRPGALGRGF